MSASKVVSAILLVLIVALGATSAGASPGKDSDQSAKKFKIITQQIPSLLQKYVFFSTVKPSLGTMVGGYPWGNRESELRIARRTDATEAKVVIQIRYLTDKGVERAFDLVIIHLKFFEGVWTTCSYESTWLDADKRRDSDVKKLMLDIDELSGKNGR